MIHAFKRVVADLDALGARYALVGGFAVSARAEPRFTRDVDFAVAVVDDSAAEALIRGFSAMGYAPTTVIEQERTGRLATVRLKPPPDRDVGTLDLLFASSSIEGAIVAAATRLEVLPGLIIPVATATHLVAMKVLSMDDRNRPQDRVDALKLLVSLGNAERLDVGAALDQITRNGANRGRDLRLLLAELGPR